MLKENFMEKVIRDCPFCDKEHEVEKHIKNAIMEINGNVVEYVHECFVCPITDCEDGNSWAPGRMLDENLRRIREAHYLKYGPIK